MDTGAVADIQLLPTHDGAILYDAACVPAPAAFDPRWFDPDWWHRHGEVARLGAGRGAALRVGAGALRTKSSPPVHRERSARSPTGTGRSEFTAVEVPA